MKILGIESATAVCAAAVVEDGSVLSECSLVEPHIHSEKMVTLVDRALNEAGLKPQALDATAVSIGPGSFTGLRIGLSVAKGLAFALDKPIVSVPTLEALAAKAVRRRPVEENSLICCLLDARRDEVYVAGFRQEGELLEEVAAARAAHLEELANLMAGQTRIIVSGDGAEKFRKYLEGKNSAMSGKLSFLSARESQCSASAVALLGEEKFLRGEVADVTSLEPLYVKDFYTLVNTQHQQA